MLNLAAQKGTASHAAPPIRDGSLRLVSVPCCLCERADAEPLAVGEDFEYRTSPDSFLAVRCRGCGLVYLDPRPADAEFRRIYPDHYHAFAFSEERFGLIYKVRRRLEARRLLSVCGDLAPDARVLDVGCGDGFHLGLLREFGQPGWRLEGVDLDERAVRAARARGITVHHGSIESLDLPEGAYDLALAIQTIEHVGDPPGLLSAIRRVLRPGGRLLVVTDNTDSLDFRVFRRRHWGGYHFPRHWNLFNPRSMRALAARSGLEVERLSTAVSPVNWVYSVRNLLDDWGAPRAVVDRFSLESPVSLAAFTAFDTLHDLAGRGALLRAVLRRPMEPSAARDDTHHHGAPTS
jgi:SAM-dependent methyltransferase